MSEDLIEFFYNQYTATEPCGTRDEPNAHAAFIRVGVQRFNLTPCACETREEADWMREMAAKAMARAAQEAYRLRPMLFDE